MLAAKLRSSLLVHETEIPDEDAEAEQVVPNLMDLAQYFENADVGLGKEEMFRVFLAIKQLAEQQPREQPRGCVVGAEAWDVGPQHERRLVAEDLEVGQGAIFLGGGDFTGSAVSAAGDVDGDGFADFLVGASDADVDGTNAGGQAFLLFGSALSAGGQTLGNSGANSLNGTAVDDTLIGAQGNDTLNGGAGNDVLLGGAGDDVIVFDAADVQRVDGGSGNDTLAITGTGVTFDLTGINGAGANYGRFINIEGVDLGAGGNTFSFEAQDILRLTGNADFGVTRESNLLVIDGDASDSIVSADSWQEQEVVTVGGTVYTVYASSVSEAAIAVDQDINIDGLNVGLTFDLADLDGSNGFVLAGGASQNYTGASVAGVADVNGDGFADMIIGAPGADDTYAGAGKTYVVFGAASGFASSLDLDALDGSDGFVVLGADGGEESGFSVSGVGDLNADGIDDLIIGGPLAAESYVVFGTTSGFAASLNLSSLDGSNGFTIFGFDINDSAGYSVSGGGDINGDGIADFVVGAPDERGADYAGHAYVVFGTGSGFPASLSLSALSGSNGFALHGSSAFDYAGTSVNLVGDVNGDGIDDLAVGAPGADAGGLDRGEAYVVFGTTAGFAANLDFSSLSGPDGFTIQGSISSGRAGTSVNAAGDVNGDGFADLIIGAPLAAVPGAGTAGQSYVVFGAASGLGSNLSLSALDGSNGFAIDGTDGSRTGQSVSAVGDVNGDGIDDLLVGSPSAPAYGEPGSAHVIFGTTSGFGSSVDLGQLGATEGVTLAGIDPGDVAGKAVAAAGDVDGDGLADILVGAQLADVGAAFNAGEAYLIFGTALANPDATVGDAGANDLAGTAAADTLIGAQGNDTLDGGAGSDVLLGGAGDDEIVFDSADVRRVDGGTGLDTLLFETGGNTLDLGAAPALYRSIESIDLGGLGNTLDLSALDVTRITGNADFGLGFEGNTLLVDGGVSDTVTSGDDWAPVGVVTLGGQTYTEYAVAGSDGRLLVNNAITVHDLGLDGSPAALDAPRPAPPIPSTGSKLDHLLQKVTANPGHVDDVPDPAAAPNVDGVRTVVRRVFDAPSDAEDATQVVPRSAPPPDSEAATEMFRPEDLLARLEHPPMRVRRQQRTVPQRPRSGHHTDVGHGGDISKRGRHCKASNRVGGQSDRDFTEASRNGRRA